MNRAITSMAQWLISVQLETGILPRFNDSAADSSPSSTEVLDFAISFLNQENRCKGLRMHLLVASFRNTCTVSALPSVINKTSSPVTDLPSTGWTFLRPNNGWEVVFKCGTPCPPHLPAHVHSDQLSFELI